MDPAVSKFHSSGDGADPDIKHWLRVITTFGGEEQLRMPQNFEEPRYPTTAWHPHYAHRRLVEFYSNVASTRARITVGTISGKDAISVFPYPQATTSVQAMSSEVKFQFFQSWLVERLATEFPDVTRHVMEYSMRSLPYRSKCEADKAHLNKFSHGKTVLDKNKGWAPRGDAPLLC